MLQLQNRNTSDTILHLPQRHTQTEQWWQDYFDPAAALESVVNHIETLPGSRHERHTMRAYLASLADYCKFLGASIIHQHAEKYVWDFYGMSQPTKSNTAAYIADRKSSGLSSSTITRYMASVRLFLRALEEQQVVPQNGGDFVYIIEVQRQFRLATSTKNPPPDTSSNRPALENTGTRLSLHHVNKLFTSFRSKMDTIGGLRDLAIFYLGINSGLRAAELARIKLENITQGEDTLIITVRGKRSNFDPVPIDDTAYDYIMSYVEAFNDSLEDDDPRRIDNDTPIWQPLLRGDKIPPLGLRGNTATSGLSARAILKIVSKRSMEILGFKITTHDMRRTYASLARSKNVPLDAISVMLRHKDPGTTAIYIGKRLNLSTSLLSSKIKFRLPL